MRKVASVCKRSKTNVAFLSLLVIKIIFGNNFSDFATLFSDISLSDMQIQETFSLIDIDGDNTIKRDELNGFMTNVDAENFIMSEDVDHNGIIGFDEFLRWAKGLALEELTSKNVALEVKQVFNLMDSDNDGFLALEDLQVLIANTDEVRQMINEQDIDMDGRINYSEFALLMNS